MRSLYAALIALLTAFTLASCTGGRPRQAVEIAPFTSDGCSLFPDGTINDQNKWCECCQSHDLAYWQGGSADERNQADATLRDCVLARTNSRQLAESIYLGARVGGHPAFPTWYRWGYGWPYSRGYQPLSEVERLQIQERLTAYAQGPRGESCAE